MSDVRTRALQKRYLRRERRSGGGFRYLRPDGREYRDRAGLARVAALAVPPAYKDVYVSPDPDDELQAFGRDARGRLQYRYHPDFVQQRALRKWQRLARFAKALPQLRERASSDMRARGLPARKVLGLMVCLLDCAYLRVGCSEYARENHSHGLATLQKSHVRVQGDKLIFHYTGKHGVEQTQTVCERRYARAVKRLLTLPGDALFQYDDGDGGYREVHAADLNEYIRESAGAFTAKDFRTWGGTARAASLLAGAGVPESQRSGARVLRECVREVAAELGNTPAVTRSSYVCPVIFDLYLSGDLAKAAPADEAGLLPEEVLSRLLLRGLRRSAPSASQHGARPARAAASRELRA